LRLGRFNNLSPKVRINFIRFVNTAGSIIPIDRTNSNPTFVLPLPNKEKCTFPLYLQESVSDLIIDIREEDRENSVIFIKDTNGIKISPSTLIKDLIKTTFIINIDGNEEYTVSGLRNDANVLKSTELENLVTDSLFQRVKDRLFSDTNREHILTSEYIELAAEYGISQELAMDYLLALRASALVVYFPTNEHLKDFIFLKPDQIFKKLSASIDFKLHPQNIEKLKPQLAQLLPLFAPLDTRKKELDDIATRKAKNFMHLGLTYLLIQSGILAHMVWLDFNWGIMEPVTYFVFLSTVILGYSFFIISDEEYSYHALERRHFKKVLRKHYLNPQQPFNWKKWNDLNKKVLSIKAAIGEETNTK